MATEEARALNRRGTNYSPSGYTHLSRVFTPRGSLRLSTLLEVLNHVGSSLEEYRPTHPQTLHLVQQGPGQIYRVDDERDRDGNALWPTHPRRRRNILIRAWRLIKSLIMHGAGRRENWRDLRWGGGLIPVGLGTANYPIGTYYPYQQGGYQHNYYN